MNKFEVVCNGIGQGEIYIDGIDISDSCFSFDVSAGVGNATIVPLGLKCNVEIEGEGDIKLKLPDTHEPIACSLAYIRNSSDERPCQERRREMDCPDYGWEMIFE